MRRWKNFLIGRNGPDTLSITTSFLSCILLIVTIFVKGVASTILWILALLCLAVSYFRIFSRNIGKRRQENARFQAKIAPLVRFRNRLRTRLKQRNLYSFFKCPQCGTVLRVPKGKGRIRITCKNCQNVFEKTT